MSNLKFDDLEVGDILIQKGETPLSNVYGYGKKRIVKWIDKKTRKYRVVLHPEGSSPSAIATYGECALSLHLYKKIDGKMVIGKHAFKKPFFLDRIE
jgi:hypothetical protein